ncbi:hypothetical protein BS78_01G417300 [Paspalum vaginatum]|nr:hypothetical protein BS78_01G417300 [Paspalum vaginatum]
MAARIHRCLVRAVGAVPVVTTRILSLLPGRESKGGSVLFVYLLGGSLPFRLSLKKRAPLCQVTLCLAVLSLSVWIPSFATDTNPRQANKRCKDKLFKGGLQLTSVLHHHV